jgi:hypothetical protein
VALLYNHRHKQWAVVVGNAQTVPITAAMKRAGWDNVETTMGRHSHPPGTTDKSQESAALASGRGGDLSRFVADANNRGGDMHVSVIDVVVRGKPMQTWVLYNRKTGEFRIRFPSGSGYETKSFANADAYHQWFKAKFGFDPGQNVPVKAGNPRAPGDDDENKYATRPAAPEDTSQLLPDRFLHTGSDDLQGTAEPAAYVLDPAAGWRFVDNLSEGNNPKAILAGPDNELYVFKPREGETENPYGPDIGIEPGQRYRRAPAAALILGRMGIDTPNTWIAEWHGYVGSLQEYRAALAPDQKSTEADLARFRQSQLKRDLDAVDFVMGSMDRHEGNFKIEYQGDVPVLTAYDNDAAFPKGGQRFSTPVPSRRGPDAEQIGDLDTHPREHYQTEAPAQISREMATRLQEFDRSFPEAELRKYLTAEEVLGVRIRLNDLIMEMRRKTIKIVD